MQPDHPWPACLRLCSHASVYIRSGRVSELRMSECLPCVLPVDDKFLSVLDQASQLQLPRPSFAIMTMKQKSGPKSGTQTDSINARINDEWKGIGLPPPPPPPKSSNLPECIRRLASCTTCTCLGSRSPVDTGIINCSFQALSPLSVGNTSPSLLITFKPFMPLWLS